MEIVTTIKWRGFSMMQEDEVSGKRTRNEKPTEVAAEGDEGGKERPRARRKSENRGGRERERETERNRERNRGIER